MKVNFAFMEDLTSVRSCVKVYLCSNPEDSEQERKALRETVFPKVRDYCLRSHGLEFRVIDPWEGKLSQITSDAKAQQIRLQLLEECRKTSAGPFFLALVGEQYGSPSLPMQVEVSEFQHILWMCQQMGLETKRLKGWYQRDENAIPPSFTLQSYQKDEKYGELQEEWAKIRTVFQTVVTRCLEEGTITSGKARKYFVSALENELLFALENQPKEGARRCLCYVHKPDEKKSQMKEKNPQKDSGEQVWTGDPLTHLREQLLPSLVSSHQLLVYTSTSMCEPGKSCPAELKKQYIDGLSQQVFTDLVGVIDHSVPGNRAFSKSPRFQNILEQSDLCRSYSDLYTLECVEVASIKAYLEHQDTEYPLVLIGGPCSGKTVLLAHCATQVRTWLAERDPVVVIHFIDHHSSLQELLSSICGQMIHYFHLPCHPAVQDIIELREAFQKIINMASLSQITLVLILDGLDQMCGAGKPSSTMWLPKRLPANVKLLISTAPKRSGVLQALKVLYPESSLFLDLKCKERRDLSRMLSELLCSSQRRITSGQQVYVNMALDKCPLPLYVELLYRQVSQWQSEDDIKEDSITCGVHNSICQFLYRLEEKHGKELVFRLLCFITLAKSGLTESELADVLSCDDSVLSQYVPRDEPLPYKLRVPEAAVDRLLLDIGGFLQKRYVAGSHLFFWSSRHFPLVIRKLYLDSTEMVEELHGILADYFSGRWSYGRTKPFILSGGGWNQATTTAVRTYIDRQSPGQPWVFDSSTLSVLERSNVRKLFELPFHLKASNRIVELGKIATSFSFHEAMLKCGCLSELVAQLEDASHFIFSKELQLFASIFREAACVLQDSIKYLPIVMQNKLSPFLNVLPSLDNYSKQVSQAGMKINCLMGVQVPVATVPTMRCVLPDHSPITETVCVSGNTAAFVLQNGTIWVCSDLSMGRLECIHSSELKFSSAKGLGNFVLVSTQCKILLCKFSPVYWIHELNVENTISRLFADSLIVPVVEGFLVIDNKVLVWFKNSDIVSVFGLDSTVVSSQLHCEANVSCLSLSSDGRHVLCGQDNGRVLVFDSATNCCLSAYSVIPSVPIVGILHYEHETEIVCIDNFGNLYIWDVKSVKELSLEHGDTDDEETMTNYYFAPKNRTLMVCKRHQILFWDTSDWGIEDRLIAPENKTFMQAMLAKECNLIIATLQSCSSILVWRRHTGQCLLYLDAGCNQPPKFFNMESSVLAVTSHRIAYWDLDLIWGASLISKTGRRVERIVVGPEQTFYTFDNSELVSKWSADGREEGFFKHEGLVETFALSVDGNYLVSASYKDTYVWDTDTRQNIQRIRCHLTSQLLITPNGNFVVSLCEEGLSRVWKLRSGHVVCNVHYYLSDATISPESTFILGLNKQKLLAISLWSGCVSKRFSSPDQADVMAFKPLVDQPNYVVVLTVSGCLFTWNITEETICQHLQVPCESLSNLEQFYFSSNAHYAMLSTSGATINLVDTQKCTLSTYEAEGKVLQICLDTMGRYVVFTSESQHNECACDLHSKPVLNVVCVSSGKKMGRFSLCSFPSTLSLTENHCAYVGFEDGSIGIYSLVLGSGESICKKNPIELVKESPCLCVEPQLWLPLPAPSFTWLEFHAVV